MTERPGGPRRSSGLAFLIVAGAAIALGVLLRPRIVYELWEEQTLGVRSASGPVVRGGARAESLPPSGGVAVIDAGGDGLPDLLFSSAGASGARGPGLRLFRNLGGQHFEERTAEAGLERPAPCFGLGVGDLDGDGAEDMVVASPERDLLFLGARDGRFREVGEAWGLAGRGSTGGVAIADLDRDGRLDIAIGGAAGGPREGEKTGRTAPAGVKLFLQRAPGSFSRRELPGIRGSALMPLDANGDLVTDLFSVDPGGPDRLLLGDGTGGFVEAAGETAGALAPRRSPAGGGGAACGDLEGDGDGLPEIVRTSAAGAGTVWYFPDRNGIYRPRRGPAAPPGGEPSGPAWGVSTLDADNDGDKDVLIARGGRRGENSSVPELARCLLLLGEGGAFREVSRRLGRDFARPRPHRGAVAVDLDRDGRLDLALALARREPTILWNRLDPRAWLRVRLEPAAPAGATPAGTPHRSPPGGLGARLVLDSGGRRQVRWVYPSEGFLSSGEAAAHFGLGRETRAEELRIFWPSGHVDRHREVACGREYVAREGGGLVERGPPHLPGSTR